MQRQHAVVVQGCAALLTQLKALDDDHQARGLGGRRASEALTNRETAVLGLLAQGLGNQEIAERLFVSVNTAKGHVHNVFAKLGVRNRNQAVSRARELGLV